MKMNFFIIGILFVLTGCNNISENTQQSQISSTPIKTSSPNAQKAQLSVTPTVTTTASSNVQKPKVSVRNKIIYENSIVSTIIKFDKELPADVWVNDNFIFSANELNNSLTKIDINTGNILKTFNFEGNCVGITGDDKGNVYSLIYIHSASQKLIKITRDDQVMELASRGDLFLGRVIPQPGLHSPCLMGNELWIPAEFDMKTFNIETFFVNKIADSLNLMNDRFNEAYFQALCDLNFDSQGILYMCEAGGNIKKFYNRKVTNLVSSGDNYEPGADGQILDVKIGSPTGMAIDTNKDYLYFSDISDLTIRKISLKENKITTVAGKSIAYDSSYKGELKDGREKEAVFYGPQGLAVDKYGDVYVADTSNHAIRKITFPKNSESTPTLSIYPSPTSSVSPSPTP